MRSVLFSLCILSLAWAQEDYDKPYDPLSEAHGGIFKALPFTEAELKLISQLHATANYHKLMKLVKEKLVTSAIPQFDRRRIEKALLALRPPKPLKDMLTDEERNEISHRHSKEDIEGTLSMLASAIFRLAPEHRRVVIPYIWKDPTPAMYAYFHV